MRHVETIPGAGKGVQKGMLEGVNRTIIYCKNVCKYHNVPQGSNNGKFLKKKKEVREIGLRS
jgi:hypothetical protein